MPKRNLFTALARLWWPRRMAAVLALAAAAWSLRLLADGVLPRDAWGSIAPWCLITVAVLQVVAAIGLWYRMRWARPTTLLLQLALLLLGLVPSLRAIGDAGWWLQQAPHLLVVALLLLPEGRHARAALREPGFEPGDTTPV